VDIGAKRKKTANKQKPGQTVKPGLKRIIAIRHKYSYSSHIKQISQS
jgi:hypothetical protein